MRRSTSILLGILLALLATAARGHEDDDADHSGSDKASHATIKTSGDKRTIEANGLPDHKPGQFPNRGNPNSISAEIPLRDAAETESERRAPPH